MVELEVEVVVVVGIVLEAIPRLVREEEDEDEELVSVVEELLELD
jgi:hypothetical protein